MATLAHADTIPGITLLAGTTIYARLEPTHMLETQTSNVLDCYDEDGNRINDNFILNLNIFRGKDELVACTVTGEETDWDFTVRDLSERDLKNGTFLALPGSVYSYEWLLTASDDEMWETFYVPVPVNIDSAEILDPSLSSHLEKLQVNGLRGEEIRISANATGLPGSHVQSNYLTTDPPDRLPLFLTNPDDGRVAKMPGPVSDWSLEYASAVDGCEGIIPGIAPATMAFDSPLHGLAAFGCDIDGSGVFDPSGRAGDVIGGFSTDASGSRWEWFGEDVDGTAHVEPGSYWCAGGVYVGALHALVENADVADPGVRMFDYVNSSTVEGVTLYWDDTPLQDSVKLQSGATAPLRSGRGVNSGEWDDVQSAPDNSHGWGNPAESLSRGSIGWIDTWTPGTFYEHGREEVIVLDPTTDRDSDGLTLGEECTHGTEPNNTDTDGDGYADGREVEAGTDPLDASDHPSQDTADIVDSGSSDSGPRDRPERAVGNLGGGARACTAQAGGWLALVALFPALWRRRER